MKIDIKIIKIFLLTAVLSLSSCETIDLNQTENKSVLPQSFLDPVFTFNYVQLKLPEFVSSTNDFTQRVTRQMAMTGGNTYDNAFSPTSFDNNWSLAYNMLNAIKVMEPTARERNEYYIIGASKIIRCYVLMTLVDMYGDIPYTDALQGNGNLTPKYDSSASVYTNVLAELDDAIATLQIPNSATGVGFHDLYYTSEANWITLAKTLKIKMFNSARLAGSDIGISDIPAAINSIVSLGDYIDQSAKDFRFQYGNSRNSPNTRHPMYNDQYELLGGAYIANYMMWSMTSEKNYDPTLDSEPSAGTEVDADPRTNFYFFKQDANPAGEDAFTLPGRSRPSHYNNSDFASFYFPTILTPYVVSNWTNANVTVPPANGFWGRDHGDNGGIPPDEKKRTVGGLYPIGGEYGAPEHVQKKGISGAKGAGIMPIMMSSFVHFILAENTLAAGNAIGAKTELLLGVSQSIDRVITPINGYPFISNVRPNPAGGLVQGNYSDQEKLQKKKQNYLTFIDTHYDSYGAADKLQLIIKEYYLAAWGNGIEPYNNYRRTGYPSNFQPTILGSSGPFYSTAYYPANAVNNNPNVPANLRIRKVFWDKAAVVLH